MIVKEEKSKPILSKTKWTIKKYKAKTLNAWEIYLIKRKKLIILKKGEQREDETKEK